jgi:outer membrane lipoprotein-sorting protein
MKRLFFAFTLAACLFSVSSFAAESNTPDVLQSFFKTFKKAENVSWSEVDGMLRIAFTLEGHQKYAYYSNSDLIVLATQIQSADLPATLKDQLAKYKDFVASEVYVLDHNGAKEYCISLEGKSENLLLKGGKRWEVVAETKK